MTVLCSLLCSLHFLFDKTLDKAVHIVDSGLVRCFTGEHSGRKVFVVRAAIIVP